VNNTLPAESKPSIRIRTSLSLPHRTSDAKDEKSVDIERPMRTETENIALTRMDATSGITVLEIIWNDRQSKQYDT
jgi:hypothetical protein